MCTQGYDLLINDVTEPWRPWFNLSESDFFPFTEALVDKVFSICISSWWNSGGTLKLAKHHHYFLKKGGCFVRLSLDVIELIKPKVDF